MAEIATLSHRHVAIVDYLLAHPQIRLGEVAQHFGYTQAWLSQIIHSDAFQNMLKEKEGAIFHHTVMPLREKMLATAHIAMDKLVDMLPGSIDIREVQSVGDSMLDRLGFGSKPVGAGASGTTNIQNNMIFPNANTAEIEAARELLRAKKSALGVQVDGFSVPLALPRESATLVGEVVQISGVSSTEGEHEENQSRAAV